MLLTVQEFLKRRPDMEVHMENAIQSAINSSFILLDGECAGLISQVQAYKESGENDPNNEYYRNDFEISQLIEALTSQTQYSLNLGNDYSIGGGSYSIGNINSSYNRPEGRDIVAPGVYKLLSNARVYNLNVGIGVKQNQDHYLEGIDPADKHISISKAQADFVAKYQPNAAVGNVAYVNESKMVSFSRPQDLQIGTYNTNRIAGGEGHRNNYYEIDSVPNIAFFGNNDRGTYSAIERGEVKQILNDNYLTKEQTLRVIYASGIVWNSRLNYERGWITQEVVNNVLYWYEALEDNTNKRPSQNPSVWRQLEAQSIDLNAIVEQMKPYLEVEITEEVGQQIIEQLNNLPTLEYVEQNREQVLLFNSEQDFINFKNETGTTDRDYENVPFETGTANGVTLDTAQTITGAKTFSNQVVINNTPEPLVLKATNTNKSYILFKTPQNTSTLSIGSNATGTNIDINSGDLTIETQQTNKTITLNTGRVKLNRSALELGTIINAGYGGTEVKFIPDDNSTKTLKFYENNHNDTRRFKLAVPEPVDNNNPATKNYVDRKETAINNQITAINNRIVENNTILKRVYTFTPSSSTPQEFGGVIYRYLLQIENFPKASVVGVSADFKTQSNGSALASYWEVSYALGTNSVSGINYLAIQLTGNKALYDRMNSFVGLNIDFTKFEITVFYMENANREAEQRYQGRIVPLDEIFGGNNEN